jgi:hypothetical protein
LNLALARTRSDAVSSRNPVLRSSREALGRRLAGQWTPRRLRVYLGVALCIVLVGIGVNALVLQRERHPAPFFGSAPSLGSPAAPTTAAARSPEIAIAEHELSTTASSPALPPVRPPDTANDSASRPPDPIMDLLRGEASADATHLILAAQTALVRLGYPVKPDGNVGIATQQALRDFERAHGLPASTDITARLVKQLEVAARAGGR